MQAVLDLFHVLGGGIQKPLRHHGIKAVDLASGVRHLHVKFIGQIGSVGVETEPERDVCASGNGEHMSNHCDAHAMYARRGWVR